MVNGKRTAGLQSMSAEYEEDEQHLTLACGVDGAVLEPGTVRLGDAVAPERASGGSVVGT